METKALEFFIACVTAAGFGIAIAAFGCGIAQGLGLRSAVEGIARNPESSGKVTVTMLIGLALIELRHERAGVTELERAMQQDGLRGIMWHPSGGSMPMPRLYPFLEVAAMGKGLCLLHGKAADNAALARRFPELTFVAHAGHEEAVTLCAPLDNIIFEVVQRPRGAGSEWDFAQLVNQLGSERIRRTVTELSVRAVVHLRGPTEEPVAQPLVGHVCP